MDYNEKFVKAKELYKQADDLYEIIDECINNNDFTNALEYMGKQNKLLKEYSKLYEDATKELINNRMQLKLKDSIYIDYYHLINNLTNKNDYINLLPKNKNGYIELNPDAPEFEILLNILPKEKTQEFLSVLSSGEFVRLSITEVDNSKAKKSKWVFKEPNIDEVKWTYIEEYNLYTPGTLPPFDEKFPHLRSVRFIPYAKEWKVINNVFEYVTPGLHLRNYKGLVYDRFNSNKDK